MVYIDISVMESRSVGESESGRVEAWERWKVERVGSWASESTLVATPVATPVATLVPTPARTSNSTLSFSDFKSRQYRLENQHLL